MTITDPSDKKPTRRFPNLRDLKWPIVQALREIGGDATRAEIAARVAEIVGLTPQERSGTIPSGENRLKHHVGWACFELKKVGVLHYPKPGRRALTPLGLEVDEAQIHELPVTHEANASPSAAWVIRAGRDGERYDHNIERGLAGVDFDTFLDLRTVSSRDKMRDTLRSQYPDDGDGTISNRAGQLWRMRTDVRVGDLVVMPHKTEPHVALGTVTREYAYAGDDPDAVWPHVVSVDWKRPELPWTALDEDLRSSLRAQQSIFQINRHDGVWRFQQLLETGQDPGPRADIDLAALVEEFLAESGYPTDEHLEQERMRAVWAEKLAPANIGFLSREDFAAIVNSSHGPSRMAQYVTTSGRTRKWVSALSDAGFAQLLQQIQYLCWGEDPLWQRLDRVAHRDGDLHVPHFAYTDAFKTLAICNPTELLPLDANRGPAGRRRFLKKLGLAEPQGATDGQKVLDANGRLREHLSPFFADDTLGMGAFLQWLAKEGGADLNPDDESLDLSVLVERFRAESGYPTQAHEEQERLRAEWAEKLAPENIAHFSRHDLTGVASHGTRNRARYVYPYVRGVMQWIRRLDEDEYSRLLESIEYLCWGEDEAWIRYDQLTDRRSARRVRGFGDSTAIRLLAITHPRDFLPIGPRPGLWSRYTLLRGLGLQEPQGSSHGQRVVDGNNRLLKFLAPHFGDDTLEMGAFLEWLIKQKQPVCPAELAVRADLSELAAELLIDDVAFLEDIVDLLQDKGQVILYGPPGTGKTYLARELAKELAPDDSCRALVQFHPSTSYEDFFEGYRPAGTGDDGNVRYELTPGPLARMAEQASDAPDEQHMMIIDEINRGNLPRVLGELLFLLEYRDESVSTLYRPEEPFSLPGNLWFVGTMNTADRSIALVDAALRRRFHFVPFFPDSGPMAGLLDRWLEREGEPDWVGSVVEAVNGELKRALDGSHLLLGPSHFMKEYGPSLDDQRERLRRIWKYNIEPFIEDQFFGNPDQIEHFRFDAVMRRHRPATESAVNASDDRDDPESTYDPGDDLQPSGDMPDESASLWLDRAGDWPPPELSISDRYGDDQRSVIHRWVKHCIELGRNPGERDEALVNTFLASLSIAESSAANYRSHLNRWFSHDHQRTESADVTDARDA